MNAIGELVLLIAFLIVYLAMVFLLFNGMKIQKRLDRYRIKYGFDRELERKDISNATEHKLDEVENRFKKRVFKD